MKGPSIAVMLGHPSDHEDDDDGVGLSHGESKSAGEDAGKALISASKSGDGAAVYRAVCAMLDLHESEEGEEEHEEDGEKSDSYGDHEGLKEDVAKD